MRDRVTYEWVFEEYDRYGDIVDPLFSNSLDEALRNVPDIHPHNTYGVAVVRYVGNEEDGESSRDYAYIQEDNTLPSVFEGTFIRVPMRYHRIVAATFKQEK